MTTLISQEQVKDILHNPETAIQIVEQAFRSYDDGHVMLPTKISQIFDQEIQNRINCMPATLLNEKVCGVKWVSVFPDNPKQGIKNVSGLIVLSEIEHGLPIAVMDGTEITNIRTAAVGGVALKYLARQNSESIGFIGAGREARTHLDYALYSCRNLKRCYVSSRSESTVVSFIKEKRTRYPQIEFINCGSDFEKAVRSADIIITATSTQADLLKAAWIKDGATYVHVGGWEDEFAVVELADKIVCDDWECVKHRGQTLCRMYKAGRLQDSDIYADLKAIITKKKRARENDAEFIYFNSVGLAFIDIAFAYYVYELLKDKPEVLQIEF